VLDWLAEHIAEPLTLEQVAARAHMSTRTLVRRFRAETGESLAGWIARRRVERARALLEDSDLTVTQVAHAAGFGSTESMRRQFLTHTGTSPRSYRDAFRGSMRQ
jgi:AraC family transcriptional regulator, transcriptional activator FtrA